MLLVIDLNETVADVIAEQRHLRNAPIVEAIIDLRAKLPSNFEIRGFSSLKQTLQDDYPKMEERQQVVAELQMTVKRVRQSVKQTGLHAYFFKSEDDKNIAQFRGDGFAFSRLHPYTDWQTVVDEAKRLWKLYVDQASPDIVTRIAVRYINQINIPLPIDDLSRYLASPPTLPPTWPQPLRGFMTRMVICDEEKDLSANIIQALERSAKFNCVTVILDIDVYKEATGGFEDRSIWQTFEQLRELKNRIFFGSITEETVRLFE